MSDEQKIDGVRLPPVQNPDVLGTKNVRQMTQEQIDAETSRVRLESEKLKLQRELLELEKLTSDIEGIRVKRANSTMAAESNTESLNHGIADRKNHEEQCTHMKGGASEDLLHGAISRGTDSTNYAMITHTLITGVRFRMCQRCGRTWFPMDPDYKWAMSRPSKNSESGSCSLQGLIRDRSQIRVVSEIPHTNVAPPADPFTQQGPAGY